MELGIRIQVDELPEGVYLTTSDELAGLVAQGRTAAEALDIARDVARKFIDATRARRNSEATDRRRDYAFMIAA